MKSEQETFDIVARFLLNQKEKSTNGKLCLYRGPNGTKCAAGCLIPDDKYFSELESLLADSNIVAEILKEEGYDFRFVRLLQQIHDSCSPGEFLQEWKHKMITLACYKNLSTEVFEDPPILKD